MSWMIDEHIGESRPWPAFVRVIRGNDVEIRTYVPADMPDNIVRCRDCRWAREARIPAEKWRLECFLRPLTIHYTEDDGYCNHGTRRSE